MAIIENDTPASTTPKQTGFFSRLKAALSTGAKSQPTATADTLEERLQAAKKLSEQFTNPALPMEQRANALQQAHQLVMLRPSGPSVENTSFMTLREMRMVRERIEGLLTSPLTQTDDVVPVQAAFLQHTTSLVSYQKAIARMDSHNKHAAEATNHGSAVTIEPR